MTAIRIPLRELAHARSGDKGNHSNIGVFAYEPHDYPLLVACLAPEPVATHFAHRRPREVLRYLLPRLHGLNLVLLDVLDGGVNDSLNLDMHGKALSFHILEMTVELPTDHPAVARLHARRTSARDPS